MKDLRSLVGTRPLMLPGASVLILDRHSRVLLQKRGDNGLWGPPGGLMELGETVEQTAIREVYEETGLTVRNLELFGVYSGPNQYYKYPNGDEAYHIDTVFITKEFEETLRIDGEESVDLAFFNLRSLPLEICPPDKPILEDLVKMSISLNWE